MISTKAGALAALISTTLIGCGGGGGGSGASNDGSGSAPVADAGADLVVNVGEAVQLDGSLSRDVDGDTLSYAWAVTGSPVVRQPYLDDADTQRPTLSGTYAGEYTLSLVVNDGAQDSAIDTVSVIVNTLSVPAPPRTATKGEIAALYTSALVSIKHQLRNEHTYQLDSDIQFLHYAAQGKPTEGALSLYFYAQNDFGVPLRSWAVCPVEWADGGRWDNVFLEDLRMCILSRA